MLVHLSSVITLFAKVFPAAGEPADATSELSLIEVMLYEATVGVLASVAKLSATAASEQTVLVWLATTGSGLTVTE